MSECPNSGRRRPSRDFHGKGNSPPRRSTVRRRESDDSEQSSAKLVKREDERPSTSSSSNLPPRHREISGGGDSVVAETQPRRRRDAYEIVHTRPSECVNKQGSLGQPRKLQTNYFPIVTTGDWKIHQYAVSFEPPIESRRLRFGILSQHSALLGGYMFDGIQLFNAVKLRENITQVESMSRNGGEKFMITIKYIGAILMDQAQACTVLNLIIRRSMAGLNLQIMGRGFYDPVAKIDLREFRLQLWPGYQTSIRQYEKDILLNVDIMHKVMRTETVYEILRQSTQNSRDFHDDFRRKVIGMTVLTDYNNKTYCVNDVLFNVTPKETFNWKGKDISFIEYYKQHYNIRIRDPLQPMLVGKDREKKRVPVPDNKEERVLLLVPELCRATGLTDEMRSNFHLMRAMADYTRMIPDRRIERLRAYNSRMRNTPEAVKVLNDWQLTLDKNLTEVNGRVLDPQRIVFADGHMVPAGNQADWTRSFRDVRMLSSPSRGLYRWYFILPHRNTREGRNFVNALMRVSQGLNFAMQPPQEIALPDDRVVSYIRALEECSRNDPQLIMCLLPNNNAERYSGIKKKCCLDRPIPTQVITSKCASNQRGLMSVATKVAIQINCKLGYTPWVVNLPVKGLMTIGYDVVRSTRNRNKSYGALVATMDMQYNPTYYSTVTECATHDVIGAHIWPMITKALRQYRSEHNDMLPNRIVFYRCGVADGSLSQVYNSEVKMIVENLEAEYQKTEPDKPFKFAYINVTTKLNTYFFDRGQNPQPGTVIDSVITLPERYDFYLVSQSVRQGTASPTLYNVLYSNINFSPDQMQLLTYKMTHLYYNWSGTTRVPAVAQYAKKLATLVATCLHAPTHSNLEKKLYYL